MPVLAFFSSAILKNQEQQKITSKKKIHLKIERNCKDVCTFIKKILVYLHFSTVVLDTLKCLYGIIGPWGRIQKVKLTDRLKPINLT